MERFETNLNGVDSALATGTRDDAQLRLIELARGDVWPERQFCELVLVLDCQSDGFSLANLDGRLRVGELALLPRGNSLIVSAHGRVLSARLESLKAPTIPQRLRDRLIGLILRRAWASCFTSNGIVEPTLRLIEALAASKVREHQEHLDFLEGLDPRIAAVLNHIEVHYGDALTVADLAAVSGLSPSHFARTFKATMAVPVWTYVQRRRCECAREMLEATREPIAQIAYACGFACQAHFTNQFCAQFEYTPGAFRKSLL